MNSFFSVAGACNPLNDSLYCGVLNDACVFAGAGALLTTDTITEMLGNFDGIWRAFALFCTVGPAGAGRTVDRFVVGSAAADGSDRILFDAGIDALWFDADGNRAGAAAQFAHPTAGLALNEADFLIIA